MSGISKKVGIYYSASRIFSLPAIHAPARNQQIIAFAVIFPVIFLVISPRPVFRNSETESLRLLQIQPFFL